MTAHHAGTLCLLAAFILLIVPNMTAPATKRLDLFTVSNGFPLYDEGTPVISYGIFGYCVRTITQTYE